MRKFDESRQLAVALIPSNQNTRGRSVLITGRSRLRRPDRNRCSAPRRNQEVLQSKHTGEKSVEDAASPQQGCALEKVNSTENHRWQHLPFPIVLLLMFNHMTLENNRTPTIQRIQFWEHYRTRNYSQQIHGFINTTWVTFNYFA